MDVCRYVNMYVFCTVLLLFLPSTLDIYVLMGTASYILLKGQTISSVLLHSSYTLLFRMYKASTPCFS